MMASVPPDVQPRGRYTVKETCLALGVCRESLRRYELQGRLVPRVCKATGRKRYLGSDISAFWLRST